MMDNLGNDLMNREIKNEIEDIQWQIQLLRRFATIGAMSQPKYSKYY